MRLQPFVGHITYCKYLQLKRKASTLLQTATNCVSGARYYCIAPSAAYGRGNTGNSREESQRRLVLGIETSCDDTGAAVVDECGNVVGDALHSQTKTHVEYVQTDCKGSTSILLQVNSRSTGGKGHHLSRLLQFHPRPTKPLTRNLTMHSKQ